MNVLDLSSNLIKFKSISPKSAGSIEYISDLLKEKNFKCHHLEFGKKKIKNLYAEFSNGSGPNLCFAGHSDVVPPGNIQEWNSDPFDPIIKDGFIFGRGASDMKSAIAAFIFSTFKFLDDSKELFKGTLSFLITADEEGDADFGTKKVVEWLENCNRKIDYCIVGEPTNPNFLGEMIKIGRRGSLNGEITVKGIQGHVAYPEQAKNPLDYVIDICNKIKQPLDKGSKFFQPSQLVITSIDVGNNVTNLIPSTAKIKFNIRFNDKHNSKDLKKLIKDRLDSITTNYQLKVKVSGESFINHTKELTQALVSSIKKIVNKDPVLSTSGGTSDARFISKICPVLEFGLIGKSMHKVNENSKIEDIEKLSKIYYELLKNLFLQKQN
ncbi:MAG: succinyl-diaminopimelate desuccinylase [Rickettsiales bacterium]|nr:succinyl-diaminopimelate desuccinylase [Rickettsiales bacterium]|tara:strand:- start:12 stop:1154 length:1143 start_codon:yes stop_codon:yes gene_type:complete